MRDDSYLRQESDTSDGARVPWRGRAATAAGAVVSLAILAIVVIWSYRLGVRDANDVPVIRAQTEATKIKPEEPGGLEIAHQGREVYNVVNPITASSETTLAPSAETLSVDDVPIAAPTPAPRRAPEEIATTPTAEVEVTTAAPEPVPKTPAVAVQATDTPEPVAEAVSEPVEVVEPASGFAPRTAPVAQRRPTRTAAAPAEAAELAEPRAAALASRIQIQLGAFNSETIAGEQWAALKNRNGDLLSGRGRVVTPVVSGGQRLYRLRAGPFSSVDEASSLCRALKSRGEVCIVARAR